MGFSISGYSEAGICVSRLEDWVQFFCAQGGWALLHSGETDARLARLWPEHGTRPVREALLARPGNSGGQVRLFQFTGVAQRSIRAGAMPWDTGGIFDLDLRVDDLHAWHRKLSRQGWGGIAPPVDWQFGQLQVREWLARGPEGVVLALIQRLWPELEGPAIGPGFGHAFNSSQTVADVDTAVAFYTQLGFQTLVDHRAPLEGGGGAVLGIPAGQCDTQAVELVIMQPQGQMEGSVELVCLPGMPGKRLDALAMPHNLGLNLLRFPVAGIEALAARLAAMPAAGTTAITQTELAPYGQVKLLACRSPDGAWLEFFEPC
jgi:catechol 2,3-dioxygenase-like lactoylglutathione lyase family enzyme